MKKWLIPLSLLGKFRPPSFDSIRSARIASRLQRPRPLHSGIEVTSNQLVTAATTEGEAAARVVRLLGGSADRGELTVDLNAGATAAADRKKWLAAQIEATVGFGQLAAVIHQIEGPKLLRVSIAVTAGDA